MTHEIDCEYSNRKYVNEPYCYSADCTEAENEKIFEDENENESEKICFDPPFLSLGLSDECLESFETLFSNDAKWEERYELYIGTYGEISVCDYQDGKRDCTWDYTPYLEAEEEICTKVRGFYA